MEVKRGDLFYADLSVGVGSEQSGIRPVVVIQNDSGNRFSTTIRKIGELTPLEMERINKCIRISLGV